MDKFGHVRRKRFACAPSVDESKGNIGSIPNDTYLRKIVANKVEKQAPTAGCSFLNQYSSSCDNWSSSWPELAKSVTFQRRGNKSELPVTTVSDQVVKEGIKRTETEKLEDVGSKASVTVQGNSWVAAFKASNYSCKTEGCSSVNKSGNVAGLEKCCVRNTGQVHMSSWRRPKNVSSCCNRTDESEYSTCVGGVSEEVLTRDSYLDTTRKSRTLRDPPGGNIQLFNHMQKTDLPQTSSKEEGITVGESGNALDTGRYIQRKKASKEEKKRLREEEIRRRLLAPKGQTVRLVSQKMVEELLNSDPKNVPFSAYQAAAPAMNEKEFPTVEESRKQRLKLNEGHTCGVQHVDGQERIPSCATQVNVKHMGSDGDCIKLSSADEEVVGATYSVSVRNRKRKDPVQINLVNLIKAQPSRHNKGQAEKGSVSKVKSQTQKRDDLICYSGNRLDASNPERKRGKKREVPKKKKKSVLKSAILEERALRRCQALQEQSESVDVQKEGGVTVDSSTCISDRALRQHQALQEQSESVDVQKEGGVTVDSSTCISDRALRQHQALQEQSESVDVQKEGGVTVDSSTCISDRALRQHQALQEQSESVDVQKEGGVTVDSSTCISDRALRQHQALQEQSESVDVQKEGGVTVDSSTCISDRALRQHQALQEQSESVDVQKEGGVTVDSSTCISDRALRQHQALQEQSESVDVQKEGGVTVDSSTCISDTFLSGAEEIQGCLCANESGEVTGDDVRKDEGVNVTEVLNLTESLKENLSLNRSCRATALSEGASDGPEYTEEVMCEVERGEVNCTDIPSGLLPHGFTEDLWRLSIHSRKFREYCDNSVTVPLDNAVKLLLKDIVKFQDRLYHRDPVKAFARRRYVVGFREVMKYLHLKKLKLIVIAPDLEVAKQKGGIDDIVAQLKQESTAQGLPCLFALSRRQLGYLTFKKVGVSCIGISSYEGSESNFKDAMESLAVARTEYEHKTCVIAEPAGGSTHIPDSNTDETTTTTTTTTLTNQVITSFLSKLTESSSSDSSSRLLSAIEREPSLE